MNQSNHLILFTLGPVQSFIAQARKTQDLYAGSRLLSDLIKVAIDQVGETNLIFPAKGDAMPNRFLAYVSSEITDFQKFGEDVERCVRKEWNTKANKTLKDIKVVKPQGFDEQIVQHLEIYWIIDELADSYTETLKRMEKQLAAIKNIRPFSQINYQKNITGEKGRKCSLDGQRNALFVRERTNKDGSNSIPAYMTGAHEIVNKPDLSEGEGLSAVSFVKRFLINNEGGFDSTADIALKYTLNQIGNKPQIKTYIALIQKANSQLYYEENVKEERLKKILREAGIKESSCESYKICSDEIRQAVKNKGLSMQKYYAILTFDGDDMGKWLAGEFLEDNKKLEGFHKAFALQLGVFAKQAKLEVDKVGRTVYAGGDDFLGFVNLHYLLPVLKNLRSIFREIVNDPLHQKFNLLKELSFSAGICVAHYKEPLSLVLDTARNAQDASKDSKVKNAFAISVIKGSGENHMGVLPFGSNDENLVFLEELVQKLIEGDFSNNFIKNIQREFERISQSLGKEDYENMFTAEFQRLLHRSANNRDWSKEEKKSQTQNLTIRLLKLQANQPDNFFELLHIADFFQRILNETPQIQESQTV